MKDGPGCDECPGPAWLGEVSSLVQIMWHPKTFPASLGFHYKFVR
jgi:hypothetical protein